MSLGPRLCFCNYSFGDLAGDGFIVTEFQFEASGATGNGLEVDGIAHQFRLGHFRDDFQDLAEEILIVRAPGPNLADHRELPYTRLSSGIRLMPMGPPFAIE